MPITAKLILFTPVASTLLSGARHCRGHRITSGLKTTLHAIVLLLFATGSFGQTLVSGEYGFGLNLAVDRNTHQLTGYFENCSGWDEETKRPRFSCAFYIEGRVTGNTAEVLTYYPEYKAEDSVQGVIQMVRNDSVRIRLAVEHGGCWNVLHFADGFVSFALERQTQWTAIKYVTAAKSYLYSNKSDRSRQRGYVVKYDMVYVDNIEGDWAYCTFYGKRTTKGWIKVASLNPTLQTAVE